MWLAIHRPLGHAFILGWLTGVVYFGGTLYWVTQVMTVYGGLATPVALFAAILLTAYLSLFVGFAAWATGYGARRLGARALLMFPAAWAAGELGRTYVWSGFPWVLLGTSQVRVLPIVQTASLVGVYGLSMLIAAVSAAAAYACVARTSRRYVPLAATVLLVIALGAWGVARMRSGALLSSGDPITVAVVQGNVSLEEKWEPSLNDRIMGRYVDLSRSAIGRGATFILWPESAIPFYFEREARGTEPVRRLAREAHAWLLVGSDQLEPIKFVPGAERNAPQDRLYNAAFLVGPDGRTEAVYRKMHLVPFGEYVPLKQLLFFVGPLVQAVSDFSPGATPVTLPVAGHLASTAICYEVVYARLIGSFVSEGSELLTTITNDAWFGSSSAPYQHFDQAAMRAVEQGRFLARAANTGISGFVDPYGRVLDETPLFRPDVRVRQLRFLHGRTVYGYVGDSLAYAGLAATLAMLVLARKVK